MTVIIHHFFSNQIFHSESPPQNVFQFVIKTTRQAIQLLDNTAKNSNDFCCEVMNKS